MRKRPKRHGPMTGPGRPPTVSTWDGRRPKLPRISKESVVIFRRMRDLANRCTCPSHDWKGKYWEHEPCAACVACGEEHSKLVDALGLKPWQGVEDPDATCAYQPGSQAALTYESNRNAEAEALWRALAAAATRTEHPQSHPDCLRAPASQ
jgi:hypothetical protein